MKVERLDIPDVVLFTPKVFGDERGFFMETFRQETFDEVCGEHKFVQDNHSRSSRSILRGLHYQLKHPQGKLVRVVRGEVFDVAVDMRTSSATYGKWVGVFLNEDNRQMLWVPPGFAHGFYVTSDDAEFVYKCTDYYAPSDEMSVHWADTILSIDWPLDNMEPRVSDKDARGMSFVEAPGY